MISHEQILLTLYFLMGYFAGIATCIILYVSLGGYEEEKGK